MHEPSLRGIDLNLTVVLSALLTERSVTRAARRLGLSQSATSHALARLREVYADPLLVRSGRRLDPTPRAIALRPSLDRALAELAGTIRNEPAFDARTARRSFVIGTADYGQGILVEPLLQRLRREAPGVDLSLNAFPNMVELLDSGSMDLALSPPLELPRGFSSKKLFTDGFMCVVRSGHPIVRGPHLSLSRYLSLPHLLVAPSGSTGSVVDSELARRGHSRRIVLTVTSFLAAPIVVADSDLISTGPVRLLQRMLKPYRLRGLAPPIPFKRFEIHMLWHSRRDHDPAHIWLRELLTSVCAEL
ncbi:MAG TPA: LysR family transcriptional regulator [Polyangia bacterium]